MKSCQLPRNTAETTYTTSPDQIDGMKLAIYSEAMRDRQCALNHDATVSAAIVSASFDEFRLLSEVRVVIYNSIPTVELNNRETFGNREEFHTRPLYAYFWG